MDTITRPKDQHFYPPAPPAGGPASTLVLGGGLAGIAAAVRLAQEGIAVSLVETSRRLGGRATSHDDPQTGQMLDNCQHVVMGCCTNLIDLYCRLGVADKIDWHSRLHFFDKCGRHDLLEGGVFLPAPLHLAMSMLLFRTLGAGEKVAIARAMLAMIRMGSAGRDRVSEMTFGQWLRQHGQPPGAIDKFWSVVIVSALNQVPERASAAAAIHVFQDGFLAHRDAYLMGTASVPLRQLYDPGVAIIESAGGRVALGSSVQKLLFDDGAISGVELSDGSTLTADWYISTLPFDRLDKVVSQPLRDADPRLQNLHRLEHSPILGIHLWFIDPVLTHDHMVFVDSPLQWAFRKTEGPGQAEHVHCVISAADEWVDKSHDSIIDMAVGELAAYLPAVRRTKLVRGRVIKEKRATFSPAPGIDRYRPTTRGSVANLLLAGDWTATGWPATMEGAARSGYAAAGVVLGTDAHALDLPVARLVRWFSG